MYVYFVFEIKRNKVLVLGTCVYWCYFICVNSTSTRHSWQVTWRRNQPKYLNRYSRWDWDSLCSIMFCQESRQGRAKFFPLFHNQYNHSKTICESINLLWVLCLRRFQRMKIYFLTKLETFFIKHILREIWQKSLLFESNNIFRTKSSHKMF